MWVGSSRGNLPSWQQLGLATGGLCTLTKGNAAAIDLVVQLLFMYLGRSGVELCGSLGCQQQPPCSGALGSRQLPCLTFFVDGMSLVGLQACKQRRCLLFILHNQTTTLL